jgi:hypothetical protein
VTSWVTEKPEIVKQICNGEMILLPINYISITVVYYYKLLIFSVTGPMNGLVR